MNTVNNLYSEEILDHFQNPRNMGTIEGADGVGTVGNPRCGDMMKMYIKVGIRPLSKKLDTRKTEEYIEDIKFQTLGCGAAIASSSIATELVKGKTIDEALAVTNEQIAKQMGKFPPAKYHCSILAEDGVRSAIQDYCRKSRIKNDEL